MQITKKVLSLILVFVMVLGLLPATVFATEGEKLTLEQLREQKGAITVEAYTIGQGFLVEPTLYTKEPNKSTASITVELLNSKNIRYLAENSENGEFSYIGSFGFDDTIEVQFPSYIDPSIYDLGSGDGDGFLSEFDYAQTSGWVYTIDNWFASYGANESAPGQEINDYNTGAPIVLGDVIRWHFTVVGWGADCGIPGNVMAEMMGGNIITQNEKSDLIFALAAINDYYGNLESDNVYETALAVAADPLASEEAIAAQEAALTSYIEDTFFAAPELEAPREAQDVTNVLNATMEQLAATVTTPAFGTTGGEWTVLGLARGGHFAKDNAYFTSYYNRIVETVNATAASVNLSGALHKTKSTENSRLIVALSAIGKNATSVGDWNLITPYEDFNWIKKQGINGTAWALIALDSNNYATTDTTIRQQCVNAILNEQHDDGGWSLVSTVTLPSNVDVTGMVLTALYPYRDQEAVAAACAEAIAWLSDVQLDNGGFPYGTGETSESCAWAIVAAATWGINPDTDPRFIKNGNSAIDNLLSYYVSESKAFEHIRGDGDKGMAMATDQACYALVAYDRFMNGKTALYDYSDVIFDPVTTPDDGDDGGEGDGDGDDGDGDGSNSSVDINASLILPAEIEGVVDEEFNAVIKVDKWDNTAGFKLVDFVMTVPEGLAVTNVTAGSKLEGGDVTYHLVKEDEENVLRCVYFDAQNSTTLTIDTEEFPADIFTVSFRVAEELETQDLRFVIGGMSIKLSSDSLADDSQVVVNTNPVTDPDDPEGSTPGGSGSIGVTGRISFSAKTLYEGDGIDLIPITKHAVAVAVTGVPKGDRAVKLTYKNGSEEIEFLYNDAATQKSGIATYIALIDKTIKTEDMKSEHFTVGTAKANALTFGDANEDSVINAQDALAVVDAWLRKGDPLTDKDILILNVNSDSRINTFDALGIVEVFVDARSTYKVITSAATMTNTQ